MGKEKNERKIKWKVLKCKPWHILLCMQWNIEHAEPAWTTRLNLEHMISHEFGVVPTRRTCWNHLDQLGAYDLHEYEVVQTCRICSDHSPLQRAYDLMSLGWFQPVWTTHIYREHTISHEFGVVPTWRTCSNHTAQQGSLCSLLIWVFRAGSECWNYPELTRDWPTVLVLGADRSGVWGQRVHNNK